MRNLPTFAFELPFRTGNHRARLRRESRFLLYGEDVDPALDHTQKYDMVTRVISPTQYFTEVIFKDPGQTAGQKEVKLVEVTHTRK